MIGVGAQVIEFSAHLVEHLADHTTFCRCEGRGQLRQNRSQQGVALLSRGAASQEGGEIGRSEGRGQFLQGRHGAEARLVAQGGGQQEQTRELGVGNHLGEGIRIALS